MPLKSDFDKMTLDELTPIVSMRPGKEYTREELRAARLAFMEKLGCANPEVEADEEVSADSVTDAALEPLEEPILEEPAETPVFTEIPEKAEFLEPLSPISDEIELESDKDCLVSVVSEDATASISEEIAEDLEPAIHTVSADIEPCETDEKTEDAPAPSESEDFIMKADSRLARFLYILYAYIFLPLLAVESIALLLASVGTSVAVPNTPFVVLHVICATVYALLITLSWHQFLFRTELGLLLSRTLICVSILRGLWMLLSGTSVFMGIIFIALSLLFLIYFIGYDTMFTVKSPKKQRVQ